MGMEDLLLLVERIRTAKLKINNDNISSNYNSCSYLTPWYNNTTSLLSIDVRRISNAYSNIRWTIASKDIHATSVGRRSDIL